MAKREERKRRTGRSEHASRVRTLTPPEAEAPPRSVTASARPALVPTSLHRRQFLIGSAGLLASAAAVGGWLWATRPGPGTTVVPTHTRGDRLVLHWNEAVLEALRILQPPLPVAARALAIVHTCMFDAWAAYDPAASGTQPVQRRPPDERTAANKQRAISYAAYRALVDLFPGAQAQFNQRMSSLGYSPFEQASDSSPQGIGDRAARMVLVARYRDGANQLGDLYPGAYADYTGYQPANTPDVVKNVELWQPLRVPDAQQILKVQRFACPQWGNVTPFALTSAVQFVPRPGPAHDSNQASIEQTRQVLRYSAELTDETKAMAEYWSDGPNGEGPVAHWCLLAHSIARRDHHTLDQNVILFFILANAMLDTSIACWATKRAYNAAYPLTVIRALYKNQQIRAWAGPGKEVQWINGQYWLPYRPLDLLAPACPQYCSEHSAFSAAAAQVLRRFTGQDRLELSFTFPAHASHIDPGAPDTDITLSWPTFSQAAEQAGLAGRYSGTHFTQSDLDGRALGTRVGQQVWEKARTCIQPAPD